MTYPVFTKQDFMAGLDRLGENDTRKLLRGGALDGQEARWAIEWLARDHAALTPQHEAQAPAQDARPFSYAMAS